MQNTGEIIIYQTEDEQTQIEVRLESETVWLSLNQLSALFERNKSVISRHINNIYKEKELEQNSTVAKFATVQIEGGRSITREIEYYNLDLIISVGYRVKSKRGTQFRIWANKVLKEYLLQGYSINQKLLEENKEKLNDLQKVIQLITEVPKIAFLSSSETESLLNLLRQYSEALNVLDNYDNQKLNPINKKPKKPYIVSYEEVINIIDTMRKTMSVSDLFGRQKDESLKSSISAIYQTFDGKDLYPSIEEKAAHLLYFIVKNHSFVDGNKRIAAAVFLYFLDKNKILSNKSNEFLIDNSSLVALTLMIANSKPREKDLIVNIITYLLQKKK